ncbi:ribonuclease H-like domain-containing protein [Tanacetum coccineum]
MTDLGSLHYFLGIYVSRDATGMFLCQQKQALEILERAGMLSCYSCHTLIDNESKLSVDCPLVYDPTLYRSLAGSLQYLTFTRPDLSYAIGQEALLHVDLRPSTVFPGNNLLSWSSKRQATLSRSSSKAKYRSVVNVVVETAGYTTYYVRYINHCSMAHCFIVVATCLVRVLHVPSHYQFVDIFTKGLS